MTIAQANKANTLVAAKGRTVTFIKLSRATDDAAKPWRGAADPRTTPEASASVPVVVVPPTGVTALGFGMEPNELVKRAEQIMIAAPGGSSSDKLEEFDEVIDTDLTTWKIGPVQALRYDDGPTILYYVGVRR